MTFNDRPRLNTFYRMMPPPCIYQMTPERVPGRGDRCCLPRGAVAILILLLSAATGLSAAEGAPERKLQQVQEKIDALQSHLEGIRGRRDAEQRRLRAVEKRIGRLSSSLRILKRKQQRQRVRLTALGRELESQNRMIAQQRGALALQLRTAYMTGRQEYLKMFLNQQEPQKLGRVLTYYRYFTQARNARIDQLRSAIEKTHRLSTQLTEERRRLARVAERYADQKRELEQSRQARGKLLTALKRAFRKGRGRLEQLRQDEQRLTELLSRMKQAQKAAPPFGNGGQLPWPVEGAILAGFGTPRTAELRWKGVLIAAAEGEPVQAIAAGKVVFADWLRGYGLLVIIDHGGGYMSLYGHNQSLQKETGSRVTQGEVISTVGNSGGNERAGLYFEIRHNGEPVDPMRWCVARK